MRRAHVAASWLSCLLLLLAAPSHGANHNVAKQLTDVSVEIRALHRDGQYTLGIKKAREAVALGEQTFGANNIWLADALFDLASLLRDTARYSEARTLYERSVKILEANRGRDDPYVGSALNSLGGLLVNTGNFAAAKPVAERAHKILESSLHPSDLRLANSLNTLGRIALETSDYPAAKPLFERALKIRQAQRRPPAWLAAQNYGFLGRVHLALKDDASAKNFYQQALQLRERQFDPDHPSIGGNFFSSPICRGQPAIFPPPSLFMSAHSPSPGNRRCRNRAGKRAWRWQKFTSRKTA